MRDVPDDIADVLRQGSGTNAVGSVQPRLEPRDTPIHLSTGDLVGQVCYCPTYECNAYWSRRVRQKHRYIAHNSYGIDQPILDSLVDEHDVKKVFIGVAEERSVFEFDVEQYIDGKFTHHKEKGYGPQRHVSIPDAVNVWEDALDTMQVEAE